MTLSREERDARRARDRAIIEEAGRKDRAEKVAVIEEIIARTQRATAWTRWLAEQVYDGLREQNYLIVKFTPDAGRKPTDPKGASSG